MRQAMRKDTVADQTTEIHRHAYNVAFDALGLSWHWDEATYIRLQSLGHDGVRVYLETEQSHLLRAYEADFLVHAIEAAKARSHGNGTTGQVRSASFAN